MTKNQYDISFASENDAITIATIHVTSWQAIYRGLIPDAFLASLSIPERTNRWRTYIKRGLQVLLIHDQQTCVGFASINATRDVDLNPKTSGEISAIYLLPDYWRRGIGKQLCEAALQQLKTNGFKEAIVWVLESNVDARDFYVALGFKESGKTKTESIKHKHTYAELNEIRYHKTLS